MDRGTDQVNGKGEGSMTETWKMYIWMGIALIDTYIIIKDHMKNNKGGKMK